MMASDPLIPFESLQVGAVTPQQQWDAWADVVRPIYDITPIGNMSEHQEIATDIFLLDNLVFTDVTFNPQVFDRHSRHIRNDDFGYLSLQIYHEGGSKGLLGGTPVEMKPGEIHILDFSQNWRTIAQRSRVAGVVIAHSTIGYDPKRHPPHMKFDIASPTGQLLYHAFGALMSNLPRIYEYDAPALASGFSGLLRGLLFQQPADKESLAHVLDARRSAIRHYVERNLYNLDMNAQVLCQQFSLSRATIYRYFEDVGGMRSYITSRRLERAMIEISRKPAHSRQIGYIAAQLGFTSPSHFSTIFRKKFGISPSDAAGSSTLSGRGGQQRTTADGLTMKPWLEHL